MNASTHPAVSAAMLGLPAAALPALRRALAAGRSPEEAAELARGLGYDSGEAFHRAFAEWLHDRGEGGAPADLPAERFWPLLAGFFSSLGWGELDLDIPRRGVATLSSSAWAEADADSGAAQPTCHLTTGILAELLARVAGTDLAVMEVECRSRGDLECRFLLGSPDALERVHARLVDGEAYPEALQALG